MDAAALAPEAWNCSIRRWAPDSTNNNVSKWTLKCGNGVINSPEAWDDKNNVSGDGCSSTCTIETGYEWAPDSTNNNVSKWTLKCGNWSY